MHYVEKHLRECAEKYAGRAANPVVAWDGIGAKSWVTRCEQLADAVAQLAPEAALEYLQDCRKQAGKGEGPASARPLAFLVSLDMVRELDTIIDPISVAHTGWIEAQAAGGLDNGKMSIRPAYRRMLGVNHCVAYCSREPKETDEAWLERRAQWFSRYHPDIWVTAKSDGYGWALDGGQCTSLLGRIEDFVHVRHLRMDTSTCVACRLPTIERRRPVVVASYSTECGPMCGVCHSEKVPHRHIVEDNDGLPFGLKLVHTV